MSAPDPTTTIRTASEAGSAAARLMREAASVCPEVALRDPHGFWRGQAEMSLASLLYGLARRVRRWDHLGGAGVGQHRSRVHRRTRLAASRATVWRPPRLGEGAARAIDGEDRQRHSMLLVLHDVFDYLAAWAAGGRHR